MLWSNVRTSVVLDERSTNAAEPVWRRGFPGRSTVQISPVADDLRGWRFALRGRDHQEDTMGKTGRKRRGRKKKAANHGKRPNA
jgi:hypothetical protein